MPVISRDGIVATIQCHDALEFMAILDPVDGMFRQAALMDAFIFRGVRSADHKLLPSAFRTGIPLRVPHGSRVAAPLDTVLKQCESELATIRRFFEIAAKQGVRLPEDSQVLRNALEDWDDRLGRGTAEQPVLWPPSEFFSLIALAQHYGIRRGHSTGRGAR